MSASPTQASEGGIGICGVLTVVFVTLKLVGVINWSWWWVLAPLWAPLAFVAIVLLIVLGFAAVLSTDR